MNEIYVASPTYKINSDKVFTWSMLMALMCGGHFAIYRVLIAVNENKQIMTQFPIARQIWRITKGDVLGFDTIELHLIKNHPTDVNTDFRIVLKAHYVVYLKVSVCLGSWRINDALYITVNLFLYVGACLCYAALSSTLCLFTTRLSQ